MDREREVIGALFQSEDFALEVANLMRVPGSEYKKEEWGKICLSLPRLYAVVEAAEIAVKMGLATSLIDALEAIATAPPERFEPYWLACIAARLAWQAQQPLIGKDRIARPIMAYTSGNLPFEEFQKDDTRVRATASLVLERLKAGQQ